MAIIDLYHINSIKSLHNRKLFLNNISNNNIRNKNNNNYYNIDYSLKNTYHCFLL